MEVLPDLVSLLKEQNQQVRYEAARLISPFATEPAGRLKLVELDAIPVLIRLLSDLTEIAHHALITLINLSEEPEAVKVMLKRGLVSVVADCMGEEKNKYVALHASLLSNLTLHKEGLEQMEKIGFRAFKLVHGLISTYIQSPEKNHPIGLALVNIGQLECVREAMLDPALRPLLLQLLTFKIDLTAEKTAIRRTIYKITRNLCFGEKNHKILLTEVNIIPILLAPLRGPETLDTDDLAGMDPTLHAPRPRETNTASQIFLLEALHLLTGTRRGRAALRGGKAYPILREFDKTVPESEEEKKQAILTVVDVLISDEGDTKDEYDDDVPSATDPNKKPKLNEEAEMEEI